MTTLTSSTTTGIYQPLINIRAFVIGLETLANGTIAIAVEVFSDRLAKAFELTGKNHMGGGTRLFDALAKTFSIDRFVVQEWSRGRQLPRTTTQRRLVLRDLCSYLNLRYR